MAAAALLKGDDVFSNAGWLRYQLILPGKRLSEWARAKGNRRSLYLPLIYRVLTLFLKQHNLQPVNKAKLMHQTPPVSLIRAQSYELPSLRNALETLLEPLGGMAAFVKPGDGGQAPAKG